jgi:hypothetical protein
MRFRYINIFGYDPYNTLDSIMDDSIDFKLEQGGY